MTAYRASREDWDLDRLGVQPEALYGAPARALLTILSAPRSTEPEQLARWLHCVGTGASQLLQEAACEPERDRALVAAMAWLAADLGSICVAFGRCIEGAPLQVEEDAHAAERIRDMRRLLEVGRAALADSPERAFVRGMLQDRIDDIESSYDSGLCVPGRRE